MADPRKPLLWLRICPLVKWLSALAVSWLLQPGDLGTGSGRGGGGGRRRRNKVPPWVSYSRAEVGLGAVRSLVPQSPPFFLELLVFWGGGSYQKYILIAEHLWRAKTWSHSAMMVAAAKEGASEVNLGPMRVSPPKVRCDHLQLPSHNPRLMSTNKHRARVTPRSKHTGESGRGIQAGRFRPCRGVELGWEEVRVVQRKGFSRKGLDSQPLTCPSQGNWL